MTSPLKLPLDAYLDALAGADRTPAGATAAAVAVATGLALFEKALRNPPTGVAPDASRGDLELVGSIRRRVVKLIETAARTEAPLPAHDAEAEGTGSAGLRLPAYRAARSLIDLATQGLGTLKPVLDMGGTGLVADLDTAWRLQAAGLESAIALCEEHLRRLPPEAVHGEATALAKQAKYGRELTSRAVSELAWRMGKC